MRTPGPIAAAAIRGPGEAGVPVMAPGSSGRGHPLGRSLKDEGGICQPWFRVLESDSPWARGSPFLMEILKLT